MEKSSLPNCKADKEKLKTYNLATLDITDSLAGRPSASRQIRPDTGRKEINEGESGNHESNICSKMTENTFTDSRYMSTHAFRLVQRRHTLPRNPLLHEYADIHNVDLGCNRASLPATLCNSAARRASFGQGAHCGSCGWMLLKVSAIFMSSCQ